MQFIKVIAVTVICLLNTNLYAADIYDQMAKVGSESAVNLKSGGFQFIYNKSNRTVVIELGDFFPTPYKLEPGQSTIAVVSSDRQSITIRSAD